MSDKIKPIYKSQGEKLVEYFEEKVVEMVSCFHEYYEAEQSPEYKQAVELARAVRKDLLDYIRSLEPKGE